MPTPHQDFQVHTLLVTPLVEVRDVVCAGTCRHKGEVERAGRTHLVFPYRGTYVRHVGHDDAVADASQVLFFNAGEDYQVSHPNAGGDASLSMALHETLLREIAPPSCWPTASHCGSGRRACASIHARRCWWRCCATPCARASPSRWKARASR